MELLEIKGELVQLQGALDLSQNKLIRTESELTQLQVDLAQSKEENEKYREKTAQLKIALTQTEKKYAKSEKKINDLNSSLKQFKQNKDNVDYKTLYLVGERRIARMQREIASLNENQNNSPIVKRLKRRIESLENLFKRYKEEGRIVITESDSQLGIDT